MAASWPQSPGASAGWCVQLDGAARSFEVDVLCLGYGFEPSNELLRVLGCGHDLDPVRRHLVTRRDDGGRTDVAGIYALGDCTGLGGARAALAEGTIVGLSVAQDLGHAIDAAQRDRARATLRRHRRFQRALWELYDAPPYSTRRATAETVICRCEEVTLGQIEQALAEKMTSAGDDQAQDAARHGALPGPLLRAGAGSAAGGAARHGARRVHRLRAARPGEAGADRRTGASRDGRFLAEPLPLGGNARAHGAAIFITMSSCGPTTTRQ